MSRPGYALRDAALGYASRGIPVLPLHYPVAHLRSTRGVPDDRVIAPEVWTGCSCGDRGCGQVGKHPLGSLVPHGLREATTNRARVLAWWTRHPQANVGLATGYRFDVLDLDGPEAVTALRAFARQHDLELPASGPVVRSGRTEAGWHYWPRPGWAAAAGCWTRSTTRAPAPTWLPRPAGTPPATPTGGSATWSTASPSCPAHSVPN